MKRGHREIVVDGYNLIHQLYPSLSAAPLEVLRQETEKKLIAFQKETKSQVTIVYDGKGSHKEHAVGAPLHIVFTPNGKSADLWIIDYVKSLNTRVKIVTIVSSDDEIRRYAIAFGAKCIKSGEFAAQLKTSRPPATLQNRHNLAESKSGNEKKFNTELLSDREVDRWMKLFTRN